MTAAVALCACGCGEETQPYARTIASRGQVAGEPARFVRGHGIRLGAARRSRVAVARARTVRALLAGREAVEGDARARYMERMRHASELVVGAVHDETPEVTRARIWAALGLPAPEGMSPVEALLIVLAAQVDPEASPDRRLGWTAGLDAQGGAA